MVVKGGGQGAGEDKNRPQPSEETVISPEPLDEGQDGQTEDQPLINRYRNFFIT